MKPNINEATINKADVNAILKAAAEQRKRGPIKRFYDVGKKEIDVNDLQKAWAKGLEPDGSDGYSNDTADIKRILQKFGYGDKEINKVFTKVFKTDKSNYDDEDDAPRGSEHVQKAADFIKKNGFQKHILAFLEQEFGDEIGLKETIVVEEIRELFTAIVKEERTEIARLIKEEDRILLGRTRK